MATKTYDVKGMTCGHCVASVRAEIERIPGVTDVDVDLATGKVKITSDIAVDDGAVTSAMAEAGYEVVSATADS